MEQQHKYRSSKSKSKGAKQAGNQAGQNMSDSPQRAPESGEPSETGRRRGRPVDEQGQVQDRTEAAGEDENWESGRQKAE